MKAIIFLITLLTLLNSTSLSAQDSVYARKIINELTAEKYHGRGYVKDGDTKVAKFIAAEFKRLGLLPINDGKYFQSFNFPVNTFPSCMEVQLNGKILSPGIEYIIDPSMPSVKGDFDVVTIDKKFVLYSREEIKGKWILIDTNDTGVQINKDDMKAWRENSFGAAGMLFAEGKKLTWSVDQQVGKFPEINILKSALSEKITHVKLDICNNFIPDHPAMNVLGLIPGTQQKDSFIFITAHYDHLGQMGSRTYFPGANDNASGISMLLNLAQYFNQPENRQPYSFVFIAFAGEEAGLLGSKYFTEHPLIPLPKIRFLLNLDLLGTGDDGMMVVNATEYPEAFQVMNNLNEKEHYLSKIGQRGKAANSDHYFFTEAGVPAFFCYTLGGISAYHDVYDRPETLPLTKYNEVFKLFTAFLKTR